MDRYTAGDADDVMALILPIQREEFAIDISAEDQPDLMDIKAFYQTGAGDFWLARQQGAVVGTIGLKDIGNNEGALRKMFVAAPWRGRQSGVARQLLEHLINTAEARGLKRIYLGTTEHFTAAHRFYEKHGFEPALKQDLPASFPLMMVDTRFYVLTL